MKYNFLQFKKNKLPALKSLRPSLFNTDLFWFVNLGVFMVLIIIMALVSLYIFSCQYFEDHKKTISINDNDLVNIERLNDAVNKRNIFVNKEISLPPDPSI